MSKAVQDLVNQLVEQIQSEAAEQVMQKLLSGLGVSGKPAVAATVAATEAAPGSEARKQALLSRSSRPIPKLTGNVTIVNPPVKEPSPLVNADDANFGLLGSGCYHEGTEGAKSELITVDEEGTIV